MGQNSLQIAGLQLVSNRKANYPSKYERSHFNKEGSSLIGKGYGQRNVALSMAARKKEMLVHAEQTAQVIEQNKKKVLDALNKNYKKQY